MKRLITWLKNVNQYDYIALFVFAAVTWAAHFSRTGGIGFYEDDYYFVSPAMSWDLSQLFDRIWYVLSTWEQGRPVGFSISPLLSFIGYRAGGVAGIFGITFLILVLNAFLFYKLIWYLDLKELAVLGGILYILFPADTTRVFLMHGTGLQPSNTFLLVGLLLYLRGHKVLPYCIALLSLLTYESPFMLFIAAPFLKIRTKPDKTAVMEFFRHLLVVGGMILIVVVIRLAFADNRVTGMVGFTELAWRIVTSMVIGPVASMGFFLFGPLVTLPMWNSEVLVTFILSGLILFALLSMDTLELSKFAREWIQTRSQPVQIMVKGRPVSVAPVLNWLFRPLIVGCVLLCLAYLLSFTHYPPIKWHGRLTSVHLAAVFGGALIGAGLLWAFFVIAIRKNMKWVGMVVISAYLALLISYGNVIQRDFSMSWEQQKSFWTQVTQLCSDVKDGSVIFFINDNETVEPWFINSHGWSDAIVFRQLYQFPAEWQNPPRLFWVSQDWIKNLSLTPAFEWEVPAADWASHLEKFPQDNLIILDNQGGKIQRLFGSYVIGDREIRLKDSDLDRLSSLKVNPLGDLLTSAPEDY